MIGWSDYVDASVLDDFTKETGIPVVYDPYTASDDLETRLAAHGTPYDVVIASAQPLQRAVAHGFYRTLDKARLPHATNLMPDVMARLAEHDPGNAHAVAYMWFATGIAYDVEKARARLDGADPATALATWRSVFDPAMTTRFSDCGIVVRDSAQDVFASALAYLALQPNSVRPADYVRASLLLLQVVRAVTFVPSDNIPASLARGEACVAVANGSEFVQARERVRSVSPPITLGFAIPKEGALIWLDSLAIPANAPHPNAAYRFIDFLLRPEIAARNSALTQLPNAVGAGDTEDASPATLKNLFTLAQSDKTIERTVARAWARLHAVR